MTEERAINYLRQIDPKHIECVELIDMKEVWENIPKAVSVAEKSLREIQQYRAIGTVEECREARERQRGKKPEHFHKKYGKHKWRRTESGEIDECAWDFGNHNGVACEICGETVCVLCNPNYDELDDCEEEYWICPNCCKKIYCKDEYCQCGQHLDWIDAQRPTK